MSDDETRGWFMTVKERGTVITKTPALPAGPAQFDQLHKLLDGGDLQCCERFPSPKRAGIMIECYCDENGLAKELPPNLSMRGHVIVGTILVVATKAPHMLGLSDDEATALSDLFRRLQRAHDKL